MPDLGKGLETAAVSLLTRKLPLGRESHRDILLFSLPTVLIILTELSLPL